MQKKAMPTTTFKMDSQASSEAEGKVSPAFGLVVRHAFSA